MRISPAIQVVGAMLAFLITSTSFGLDATQLVNLPSRWLPLIGFLMFSGFVAWAWYDMRKRISEFEEKRPKIQAIPYIRGDDVRLKVLNLGKNPALFSAKMEDIRGLATTIDEYEIDWHEQTSKDTPKWLSLPGGAPGSLEIARNHHEYEEPTTGKRLITIQFFGAPSQQNVSPSAKLLLDVTIVSNPQLLFPYRRAYILTLTPEGQWGQFEEKRDE